MTALKAAFLDRTESGVGLIRARAEAADALVHVLWKQERDALGAGITLLAVGGYGRSELFPASDLDLLFVVDDAAKEKDMKPAIRRISQQLWDSGIRVAATTRALAECSKYDPENAEFTFSLLDARMLEGEQALAAKLLNESIPRLLVQEGRNLIARLSEMTRERHARYGDTLFHLEPNIKECPGGLRDANVRGWFAKLTNSHAPNSPEFQEAVAFLTAIRCFLHIRSNRDNNVLDWKTQDAAAAEGIGMVSGLPRDAAHWMQLYFRHARVIDRQLEQQVDRLPRARSFFRSTRDFLTRKPSNDTAGMQLQHGRVVLDAATPTYDPATDSDVVLRVFQTVAETGTRLSHTAEQRLEEAIPLLSSQMDEGASLWHKLRLILLGTYAGQALRAMHALGILELLVPEFHGIDALVIRDAYHRYTVDEHTFVLIDTLHGLPLVAEGAMGEWKKRFTVILRDLQHPELLYLAALLHDTGKGHSSEEHAAESSRLASSMLQRLELDDYESGLVLGLIQNHLEMSNALRRDIFDAETVRTFAEKVQTPEELRMIALFTYADIQAVHPDALTAWKAENLWRLYIATSNYLDRNIDEERFDSRVSSELVRRITQLLPAESREVLQFVEGFPQRYLRTRSPEQIRTHYTMSKKLKEDNAQVDFHWSPEQSEITLVTPDRKLLFARIAGVLAAWGMNIITADAFSNAQGIVVDSFRFTDGYRTLEMNPSERDRLIADVHDAIDDPAFVAKMMAHRRRTRRRTPFVDVATSVEFDTESSTQSTILQVVAQDHPGLLYTIGSMLGEARCSIEVAVIDTEGDTAIDVFYLTQDGVPLDRADLPELKVQLTAAIDAHAARAAHLSSFSQ